MLSASFSAHLLRPVPRFFTPRRSRAARILHYHRHNACHVRLLSASSSTGNELQVEPSESEHKTADIDPPFSVLMQTMHKLRDDSLAPTRLENERSHFETKRGSFLFEPSEPKLLPVPVTKKFKKATKVQILPKAGSPGTGKIARRKLKKDIRTLSELVGSYSGESDSRLKPESWEYNWGEDKLTPKSSNVGPSQYKSKKPPAYVRRIEGLIGHSDDDVLEEIEPPTGRAPIATLAHGLDRVLFNPGVHWVQDPRSRVYNFTPFIQTVPDIKDFAFESLTPFIRSSRDAVMRNLATTKEKRFAGSTSSLSGLLCHIYFLLSQDREVNISTLPEPFSAAPRTFTPAQRMPTAVVFNLQNGVYLIDSDSTDNDDSQWNVLMWMGTMLENFFTLPKDEFSRLLRTTNAGQTCDDQPQAYRYSQSKLFVMRSQLDCVDTRLPGSGVFDIKTRAALPLRMDNLNFKENSGYLINSLHGSLNSFDREYYDLVRSAFLKYSFQARIGGMDGIFIAYHNTARIFGFQYVPLEELDDRLFGDYKYKRVGCKGESRVAGGKELGWRIFNKCVGMLEAIAAEIIECFPGKSVACLAETHAGKRVMHVWVQPVDDARDTDAEGEEIPIVGSDSEGPIVQLDITARSFLGGSQAAGSDAIFLSRKPWMVHWSISRSSLPESTIRQHLAAAQKRKYRPKAYPTGVNAENLDEFIRDLGFGNPESMPDTKHFKQPDAGIKFYRKISRAGRLETRRLQTQDEAKGVQIWQPLIHSASLLDNDSRTIAVDEPYGTNDPSGDDPGSSS